MLIWINGAFGAGKTQTAHELARRLGNAHVADPELAGFALHRMLPAARRADFQDLPQWRAVVVATLLQAEAAHDGPVIVPMTLVRDDYFDEIVGGLRARRVEVHHFTLTATPAVLRRRLRRRLAYATGRLRGRHTTWALEQVGRCVTALAADRFARHVPTDHASVDDVVETIAHELGLTLTRPRLAPPRHQLRRLRVGVAHIRW